MFSVDSVTVIGGKLISLRMTITNETCSDQGEYDESIWKKLTAAVIAVFNYG